MNKIIKIFKVLIFTIILISLQSLDAQINKMGKKSSSFSSAGNKWSRIRQGVAATAGFDMGNTLFLGIGYGQSQYYGVGNLYLQQSVTYQFGFLDKIHHSFEISIHNNFFGGLDLSPMVWGANLMFVKEEKYGQLFARPDIGIMFPFSYRARAAENKKLVFMLLYGYNFKLFQKNLEIADNLGVNSHYVTLRVLFTLQTFKEM